MQIAAANSRLPISAQVIQKAAPSAQTPSAQLSPEQLNSAVDRASDRVTEAQDSKEQTQTNRRTYAAQLYSANSQQNQIDTYLAVASEGAVDSSTGSTLTPQELVAAAAENDRLDISNNIDQQRPERPQPYVDTRA
jgi:predicted PP-loop superfamily ATPase